MRTSIILGSVAGAVLIAAAAIVGLRGSISPQRAVLQPAAPPSLAVAAAPSPTPSLAAASPAAPTQAVTAPSFDVMTVDPRGRAVIAGHALPGDRVRVLDGGKPLGEVTADARGEWVLVPSEPLAPGNRDVTLEASGRDGGDVRRSADVVALSVKPPASPGGGAVTMAALLPGELGKPAKILQQPTAPADRQRLALDSAGYGAGDKLQLSGHAEPGARLAIYAGGRLLGTATADAAGQWSLAASSRPGAHHVELRLDQLAADGRVVRRIAAAVESTAAAPAPTSTPARGGGTYFVHRGNTLWLIARDLYGDGMRYTAIYAANRNQIQDPDWIYPGQVFKLPKS